MRLKKRILSIALSLCMAFSMTPMPVSATETIVPVTSDVAVSQNDVITEADAAQVITEFTALADDVKEQQLEIGAEESAITLPDTLQVKVGDADVELTGIIWSIDAENSAADAYDSSEDMNGAYYTYKPVLPAEYTLAEGVELPEIFVMVGASDIMLMATNNAVEIDTTYGYIIANGNALIIDGTGSLETTVYIDSNRNGIVDSGEQSLATAGITGAPVDSSDLSKWTIFGGAYNQDFSGDSLITMNGGGIKAILGGSMSRGTTENITFTGDTQIVMTGGTAASIYGAGMVSGNYKGTLLEGNTSIKITGGNIVGYLRGGGYGQNDTVTGNSTVEVSGGSSTYKVSGAGFYGTVSGTKTGIIYGMTAGYAYDTDSAFTNGFLQTDRTTYSVVGDITLPDDFDYTLPAGTTLTVNEGATLHTGNAKFATEGTITGTGTIDPKLSVAMTGTNATTSETTYDVSGLFTIPASVGTVTYTIDTAASTGAGTIDTTDGKTLTITKSGTITVKATTQASGFYAAGEASAVLTAKGADTISWAADSTHKTQLYDGTAKTVSGTKGTDFTWNGTGAATIEGYYTKSGDNYVKTNTTDGSGAEIEGGAPKNLGIYYALVQVTGDDTYLDASSYMAFSITPQGTGTTADPYQISTAPELVWLSDYVNAGTGSSNQHAILTDDIDMTGTAWTPIGNISVYYWGNFDGKGHTITGLSGMLFGMIANSSITNVNLAGGTFKSDVSIAPNTGSLVGGATEYPYTVKNCTSSNTLEGKGIGDIGGLVGRFNGSIENCAFVGDASAAASFHGAIAGSSYTGDDYPQTMKSCYTTSGALIGVLMSGCTISNSLYTSEKAYGYYRYGGTIDTTTQQVTAEDFASGKAAYLLNGSTDTPADGTALVWYQNLDNGQTKDAYPVLDSTHGTVYFENGAYTNTILMRKPAGDGTSASPYQISTAPELYWFAAAVNGTDGITKDAGACAVLNGNITVNTKVLKEDGTLNGTPARTWTPIGTSNYTGTFDGKGFTISGLYCSNTNMDYLGLFAQNSGTIQNVTIADSFMEGSNFVGGICGCNGFTSSKGDIINCQSRSTVKGKREVGGICGYNGVIVKKCRNEGVISGIEWIGGICGYNESGTLTACSNTGAVSSTEGSVGGICGENWENSLIKECDNSGSVSETGYTGYTGGVCGNNLGQVTHCYNTGETSGYSPVGGVCAYNSSTGIIKACYNSGSITSAYGGYYGGVCGINSGNIRRCSYDSTVYAGTSVGENTGTVDELTTGSTTDEFKSGAVAYLLNGEKTDGTQSWYQNLGEGGDTYPVLESTGSNTVYQLADGTYSNSNSTKTVYQVTVSSIDMNGNVVTAAVTGGKNDVAADTNITVEAPKDDPDAYKFLGWYKADTTAASGYSGSCLSTAKSYTFSVKDNTSLVAVYKAMGKVSLTFDGGKSQYKVNGTTASSSQTTSITVGTQVTIEVLTTEGFDYWKNAAGVIVSRDTSYTFTATIQDSLTAVYKTPAEGNMIVVWETDFGQVLQRVEYTSETIKTAQIPELPVRYGYNVTGWDQDVMKLTFTAGTMVTIKPVSEKISQSYQINITGGTLDKADGSYNVNDVAKAVAAQPETGMKFSHWTDETGTIVSYSSTYEFYVTKNVTLTAVFVKDAQVVEAKGTAEIIQTSYDAQKKYLNFVSLLTVPDGATIEYAGIVATTDSLAAAELTKSNAAYVRGIANPGTQTQRVTWTKSNVESDAVWYAKAYLVYTTTQGETIELYGDLVTVTAGNN